MPKPPLTFAQVTVRPRPRQKNRDWCRFEMLRVDEVLRWKASWQVPMYRFRLWDYTMQLRGNFCLPPLIPVRSATAAVGP